MSMLQSTIQIQEKWKEVRLAMLEVTDNFGSLLLAPEDAAITCDVCGYEASIFQVEGNFCLDCWQERTEPRV